MMSRLAGYSVPLLIKFSVGIIGYVKTFFELVKVDSIFLSQICLVILDSLQSRDVVECKID